MPADYPIKDLMRGMQNIIDQGGVCIFKWTCEACGQRVYADEPNTVYTEATHSDCPVTPDHITNCREHGGNYAIVMPTGEPKLSYEALVRLLTDNENHNGE